MASVPQNLVGRSIWTCGDLPLSRARVESDTTSHTQVTALNSPTFIFSEPNPMLSTHTRSTKRGVSIKVLHSNRGGEYLDKAFTLYLKQRGMEQKLTIHDTPAHNSVAKHRNRTIVERIHALLHASGLPKFLWGEAARHIVWLMNRIMTKAVDGMTPYEAVFGRKPDLQNVREWGEKVWVRTEGGNKLGGCIHEGRWIGIDERSKGARIYWPDKKTVSVERNIYYDKTVASASHLEEEEEGIVEMKANNLSKASDLPSNDSMSSPPPEMPAPSPPSRVPSPPVDESTENELSTTKRIRKPSQCIVDLIEGHGHTSNHPTDPIVTRGIQVPTPITEEPKMYLRGRGRLIG